jgi:hypothetical protein
MMVLKVSWCGIMILEAFDGPEPPASAPGRLESVDFAICLGGDGTIRPRPPARPPARGCRAPSRSPQSISRAWRVWACRRRRRRGSRPWPGAGSLALERSERQIDIVYL